MPTKLRANLGRPVSDEDLEQIRDKFEGKVRRAPDEPSELVFERDSTKTALFAAANVATGGMGYTFSIVED